MTNALRKAQIRKECERESKIRAQRIGASAWYECVDTVLTEAEKAEVADLWKTMPGYTCWNDAFLRWMSN